MVKTHSRKCLTERQCEGIYVVRNIDNGVLRSFNGRKDSRKRRSCNDVTIKAYCHCRRLEEGDMIEYSKCQKWYHRECCNVDAKYFDESEDTEWSYMSCE